MSLEEPDWRLEVWHAGEKAAEIRNDEWERVLADLVQFSETRRREVVRARADAEEQAEALAQAVAEAEIETEVEVEVEAEAEAEAEAFAEPASTYWAHFAAAALQRKQITPEVAATMADELLAEYEKRFPEAA
jgi:hypothetical protein